jgi:hypothetical protein
MVREKQVFPWNNLKAERRILVCDGMFHVKQLATRPCIC